MKYLVIAKARPAVTQAISIALVQAANEYINACLANGSLDCAYLFSSGDGSGIGIVNADSHERVTEIILEHPAAPLYEWEVQPLTDFNQVANKMLDVLRKQSK